MTRLYRSLAELPSDFAPSVVTIGNFDGVHLGHGKILRIAADLAEADGLRTATLTFDPHPLEVVAPERAPKVMSSIEERRALLSEIGVDSMVVLPFTKEFSLQSPEEFVQRILVEGLGCACVVVGENFRFGRRQAGDVDILEGLGRRLGFRAEAVGPLLIGGQVVSSSRIRAAVEAGDTSLARRLLGRPYELTGEVVRGRGVGSRSTAPTLNTVPKSSLWPADGVYVTETAAETGQRWRSVTNVGVRPTFGKSERLIETHLLDALGGETPEKVRVRFLKRLRDERRFESPELLREQIGRDIEKSKRYFRLLDRLAKTESGR